MFWRKRRSPQDALTAALDEAIVSLRVACGLLLLHQRSAAHAGCTGWLEDLERVLARVEMVHKSIKDSQGWQSTGE